MPTVPTVTLNSGAVIPAIGEKILCPRNLIHAAEGKKALVLTLVEIP
jgi:hypothetical protein